VSTLLFTGCNETRLTNPKDRNRAADKIKLPLTIEQDKKIDKADEGTWMKKKRTSSGAAKGKVRLVKKKKIADTRQPVRKKTQTKYDHLVERSSQDQRQINCL